MFGNHLIQQDYQEAWSLHTTNNMIGILLQYLESSEFVRWHRTSSAPGWQHYTYPATFIITNEKYDSRIEFYRNGYVDIRIQNFYTYTSRNVLYTDSLVARIKTSGANDISINRKHSLKDSLSPRGLDIELTNKSNHPLPITEKQFDKIYSNIGNLPRCLNDDYVNIMKRDFDKIRKVFFDKSPKLIMMT